MAVQQEGGWPLGLRPLNVRRAGLLRNPDSYGSISFSTLVSGSPTSACDSSSDTESTGSFFHDRSITLGSLLGITSILEISSRSLRNRRRNLTAPTSRTNHKAGKLWLLFSLCAKSDDTESRAAAEGGSAATRSLAHFLEVERRARRTASRSNDEGRYTCNGLVGFDDPQPDDQGINPLFSDGCIAPPRLSEHNRRRFNREFPLGSGILLVFPCIGGEQ